MSEMVNWQAYGWMAATGIFASYLSGLLGIGGAFVMVPAFLTIFQHYLHLDERTLVQMVLGTTMACMIVNASSATMAQHRRGSVAWDYLSTHWAWLGGGTMAGALLTSQVPVAGIKLVFGAFCLYSAARMLGLLRAAKAGDPNGGGSRSIAAGFGVVCGLIGVGGANLFIPYLVGSRGLDLKKAMGTASALQIPISLIGTASYWVMGMMLSADGPGALRGAWGFIYLPAFLLVTGLGPVCSNMGVAAAHRLPVARLKTLFGIFTLVVGVRMLYNVMVR